MKYVIKWFRNLGVIIWIVITFIALFVWLLFQVVTLGVAKNKWDFFPPESVWFKKVLVWISADENHWILP